MRPRRLLLVPLLLIATCGSAAADDIPIPGLEMDARAEALIREWRAQEYNLGRDDVSFAECRLWLEIAKVPRMQVLDGTFRFDLMERKYDFTLSKGDGVFEGGWWRVELENLLLRTGWMLFLRDCKLTTEPRDDGADVHVEGESPYRAFHFDNEGVLTGLSANAPAPDGATHPVEVDYTYTSWKGKHLLASYTVVGTVPGLGRTRETGTLKWVRVLGRPVPVRIALELVQGDQELPLELSLRHWKIGAEAGPELDREGRMAVERFEKIGYHPGLWRYREATCRVSLDAGDWRATGTYTFEAERGRLDWDDDAKPKEIVATRWRQLLDQCFERYWLRKELGVMPTRTRSQGGQVSIEADGLDVFDSILNTFVFATDGTLSEIREEDVELDITDVTRITYRRQDRAAGFHQAVPFPHYVPVSWKQVLDEGGPDESKLEMAMTYTKVQGILVPARLAIRVIGAARDDTDVIELTGWKLVREPLELD